MIKNVTQKAAHVLSKCFKKQTSSCFLDVPIVSRVSDTKLVKTKQLKSVPPNRLTQILEPSINDRSLKE